LINIEGEHLSTAVVTREMIMQAGGQGVTVCDICDKYPEFNRRTVARITQLYVIRRYISTDGTRYYPPDTWPTRYFLDTTLINIHHDEFKWSAVCNLAYRVPVAPKILTAALVALEPMGLVKLTDDHQHVMLTDKGRERAEKNFSARQILRAWKPPRSW
tara:strand:- start:597 stop:1073 length:477 start_codon:yes stop_codon:yes gene_type:complete